jgi:hypothetical protein
MFMGVPFTNSALHFQSHSLENNHYHAMMIVAATFGPGGEQVWNAGSPW